MRRVWRSVLGASGALAVGAGLLSGQVQQQGCGKRQAASSTRSTRAQRRSAST